MSLLKKIEMKRKKQRRVQKRKKAAVATAVAAAKTGRTGNKSNIVMDGGTLSIEWSKDDNHVYMTGGAEFVFEGEIVI